MQAEWQIVGSENNVEIVEKALSEVAFKNLEISFYGKKPSNRMENLSGVELSSIGESIFYDSDLTPAQIYNIIPASERSKYFTVINKFQKEFVVVISTTNQKLVKDIDIYLNKLVKSIGNLKLTAFSTYTILGTKKEIANLTEKIKAFPWEGTYTIDVSPSHKTVTTSQLCLTEEGYNEFRKVNVSQEQFINSVKDSKFVTTCQVNLPLQKLTFTIKAVFDRNPLTHGQFILSNSRFG